MAVFEFRSAQKLGRTLKQQGVRYLFYGIERFEDAWKRRVEKHGFPIANIDDIVGSKQAANRQKDRESLPRLLSFREWLKGKNRQ